VKCLTEGNDRIRDMAGNDCKLVYNRIRDTFAPFLVTVTIGLHGYGANNGIRGYVASDRLVPEASLRQLVFGVLVSESVQCNSESRIQEATSRQCYRRINPVSNQNPRRVISHTTPGIRDSSINRLDTLSET
jgi:hypothetical protein